MVVVVVGEPVEPVVDPVVVTVGDGVLLGVVVVPDGLDVVVVLSDDDVVCFGVVEHDARTSTAEVVAPASSRPVRMRAGPTERRLRS